ncbi:MAG: ribonuclease P protein component [Verrucomicrobiota bacterium]
MNARPTPPQDAPAPRDERLPRARILRRRCDIQEVRNDGERRGDRLMTLFALRGADRPVMAAFQTPKRLGPAVLRNRVRRRMREIFRRAVNLPPGWSRVVWTARPAAAGAGFDQLRASMLRLSTKLAR